MLRFLDPEQQRDVVTQLGRRTIRRGEALFQAEPPEVADDVYRAFKSGKDIVYTRWFWKWIMLVIKSIPEKVFKMLKL
ncbi:MAG: hypothetical protein HQK58_04280 [Deltaproteobacteria bacterium]|nr:hypothetical protein [Deltaproteobacteria bacterium]